MLRVGHKVMNTAQRKGSELMQSWLGYGSFRSNMLPLILGPTIIMRRLS